jgi:hypothetical protein
MDRGLPLGESWPEMTCPSLGEFALELSHDDRIGKRFCCLDFGLEYLMLECELMMSKQSPRA